MNFLRNSLSVLRRLTVGGGLGGKPVTSPSSCVCGDDKLNGLSRSDSTNGQQMTRSYGTSSSILGNGSITLLGRSFAFWLRPQLNVNMAIGIKAAGDMIPGGPFEIQSRGLRYRGKVNRRCKDCRLVWVNGLLYNLCKTHKRHKHCLRYPYYVNTRILTHATMSRKRPW